MTEQNIEAKFTVIRDFETSILRWKNPRMDTPSESFLSSAFFAKLRIICKEIADVAGTKMSRRVFILIDVKDLRNLHHLRKIVVLYTVVL